MRPNGNARYFMCRFSILHFHPVAHALRQIFDSTGQYKGIRILSMQENPSTLFYSLSSEKKKRLRRG